MALVALASEKNSIGLSERERFLYAIVLELRNRGWGSYRIGRFLWPYLNPRTAQKRVQRLLKKIEALRSSLLHDVSQHMSQYIVEKPEDRPRKVKMEASRGPFTSVGRLGRTEKLVLAALENLGGRARFSAIVSEVLELVGLDKYFLARRWRNRVWQALNRLVFRGIIYRDNGVYWIRYGVTNIYVEKFHVKLGDGRRVFIWSKQETGRPATLQEALTLATLRGATKTLQVELSIPLNDSKFIELLDKYSISTIIIYRDQHWPYHGKPKYELRFDNSFLKPHILEERNWIKAINDSIKATKKALVSIQ